MNSRPFHCLFLCTGNSARSILAECLLRHHGGTRFHAASAGSRPTGRVHSLALEVLSEAGIDTAGVESKDLDRFSGPDARPMDLVVTVCDNAAGEMCPVFPGAPATVHWGLPDPAAIADPDAARAAFREVRDRLDVRIRKLVRIPLESLSPELRRATVQSLADDPENEIGNPAHT